MPGGGALVESRVRQYPSQVTKYVIWACMIAASGGLIFGYDIGVSGGVTGMDDFLEKFFPKVYRRKHEYRENSYCKYDNQALQLFTSSLYLAGLLASVVASKVTRSYGRIPSIRIGGISFLVGAALNGGAQNLVMLIIGRIMLGVGVGFGNQAVPLYLSEMAPSSIRGALNIMFQLAVTIGIVAANLINYGTSKMHPNGWRVSLGLAGVPALLMTAGGFYLSDTPNSLVERGYLVEGKAELLRIRGVPNVDEEFDDLVKASAVANAVKSPFRNILRRQNRPQLVMTIFIPFFQQFTGINAIMFYAPVLFQTIGFKNDASLYSTVVTGAVNLVATFVSIVAVDKYGRRKLFLQAGVQMLLSQVAIGVVLAKELGTTGSLAKGTAVGVVVLTCIYISAFAWSWGPLGWLVPSEIFPLETRSAGQAVNVCVNLFFTFVIAQAFLSMLCHLHYGIFLFFAGWVFIMSLFIYFFLPETKNVPIEEMIHVWRAHWFWKTVLPEEDFSYTDAEKNKNDNQEAAVSPQAKLMSPQN